MNSSRILFPALVTALFSPSAFPCSMSFGTSVVCGIVEELAKKETQNALTIGMRSSNPLTVGGYNPACEWDEAEVLPGGEFTEIATLPHRKAMKLRSDLLRARERQEEICVFSTFGLRKDFAVVTPKNGQSTREVNRASLEKFAEQIQKQLED